MIRIVIALAGCATVALYPHATFAQDEQVAAAGAPSSQEMIEDRDLSWIDPSVDLRYRYEFVDQEGLDLDAHASTLRARVGVEVQPIEMLSVFAQGEAIIHAGPDRFNDTTNGVIDRPVVADPEYILLNQLYARLTPRPGMSLSAGRQTVNYDNQRWIGSVGWRQNDQTLDAVTANIASLANTGIFASYGYARRVNRIFGPDSPQGIWRNNDIHLARIGSELGGFGTLSAYGYWLDLPDAPTQSNRTLGLRVTGQQPIGAGPASATYAIEFAWQSGLGLNPNGENHAYWLVEPGIELGSASVRLGYERLGGNGTTALQTPLATLHAFNGWADKFLVTPSTGLRDLYFDAGYAVPEDNRFLSGTAFRFVFHDFRSTQGGLHYGREWDASISRRLYGPVSFTLKFAHYDAQQFASDTTKTWLQLDARF